ncbi:MAG: T9SS type A sorting domain-containing protein, partial [Bacteroidales bacterium]|nr:T9SS type A sorting domain-containing protein [Bacteroidales bacterium]
HACMSLRYPFTEWKAIDWPEKEIITRPHILDAQNSGDTVAFIQYLFEYLYQIPDGHINLVGELDSFKQSIIAGSYGFIMIPLDDGTVVVSFVPEESPAYIAGLRSGDQILKWNGTHIDSVGNKEYLNYFINYATTEGRIFSRYLMLSRDPVNTVAEITFQSNQSKFESTITLTAFDDSMEMYLIGMFNTAQAPNMDSLVYYDVLENNIGYLYIGAEIAEGITPEEIMQSPDFIKVQDAVTYFNNNDIDKLIVDLRFNLGGNDMQAAVMMGLFYENSSFYEYITGSYDDDYEIIYTLWTEPLTPLYEGEIAVIVDPNCISTGEGLAMMFQRLENAQIVSHWGTNGSFGMVDYDPVLLPAGLAVTFPQGKSLNEDYVIQLDSDSTMSGGVSPDIRVPLTVENVILQWQDGHDVQLEYAESLLLDIDEISINQKWLVYPNPCSEFLNIKITSGDKIDYKIDIYNSYGQKILSDKLCHNAGDQIFSLDLRHLNNGIYFYTVSGGVKDVSGKIVVKR